MSRFEYHKSMLRYTVFAVLLTFLAFGVLAKGFYIMTVEHDYWEEVNSMMKFDSMAPPATIPKIGLP